MFMESNLYVVEAHLLFFFFYCISADLCDKIGMGYTCLDSQYFLIVYVQYIRYNYLGLAKFPRLGEQTLEHAA